MTPESKLKRDLKVYLTAIGAYYYMPVPTGFGTRTVDFLGCWRGRFFAIETKSPGRQATPSQARTLEAVREAGGIAVLAFTLQDAMGAFEGVELV